jgi:hypothetical protein
MILAALVGIGVSLFVRRMKEKDSAASAFVSITPDRKD